MTFVTGIERRAFARGRAEGLAAARTEAIAAGIAKAAAQLARKLLGEPSDEASAWLAQYVTKATPDEIVDRLLEVKSWKELLAAGDPAGGEA